ncbi:MAG: sugar ABC transporter ATP-binding protein [Bacteriovoracaceae bacterium]|nr:sugar ABC transporter ATP-binding protein [Bacteriovoracaceae bacterium]
MTTSGPLLQVEGVSKDFFGTNVLSDINFNLEKGEILGLVGENGAGKSTLMNILFGMKVISSTGGYSGQILFEGKQTSFKNPLEALNSGIGMVHQEFSLIPGLTATENILLNSEPTRYNFLTELFGPRLSTLDRYEMQIRAIAAINKLGFRLDQDMLVSQMPVGHKQFTEISRELDRKNIKLLVLDEPTAVLTESEAQILLKSLKTLASDGIGIIIISHRLSEIMDITDKVVVLCDGKIIHTSKTSDTTVDKIAECMVGRSGVLESSKAHAQKEQAQKEIILKVENLWVDMPGEHIEDVSFDVIRGEIFGIGGLAGQGKLGIPNGIMGYFESGGNVYFSGKKCNLGNPREALDQEMAFVSEDRKGVGLLLDEPIDWNIVFTAMQTKDQFLKSYLWGLIKWRDSKAMSKVSKQYINELEIKCLNEWQHVRQLSGGNQQKICLAKAFVLDPKLLFVSEPTRGIDVGAKSIVLDTLRKINKQKGTTIIMVSSELEEMRGICDRIAIVDKGKIAGILPADSSSISFGKLMAGVGETL